MRFYRTFPLARLAQMRASHFPPLLRALVILANGNNTVADMARILGRHAYDLGLPLVMLREMKMVDCRPPYQRRPLAAAPGRLDTHHYGSTGDGRRTKPLRMVA